jgi:hypothetical protein
MTTKSKEQMYFNCLMIEAMVKTMVIEGTTDNKKIVAAVDKVMMPQNSEEMEAYSEAIIYAKCSVLN